MPDSGSNRGDYNSHTSIVRWTSDSSLGSTNDVKDTLNILNAVKV